MREDLRDQIEDARRRLRGARSRSRWWIIIGPDDDDGDEAGLGEGQRGKGKGRRRAGVMRVE